MNRKILTLCLALLAVSLLAGTLHSQDDMKQLADPAFTKASRPAVSFRHDEHNRKAKLEDCKACHHGLGKDGRIDPKADSSGTKCSDCHTVAGGGKGMPLMRAFHRQCGECHEAKGAGPVACGECHPRNPGK
ncbi:Acidic cytochrome c3 [Fundidesulfovibrio magnetotacticus]|uniref:Acidic cytochrome c3 n=1 Tax=Fundidesulfovibrio magnetotacticus TaxID=2730080 RepID=A0A6V8LWL5_9BACT|nr:cytochrome c3 family protein [Fundidesulfovibrio magnetotacticus]GFK94469.1 Acidic cytochrome c3 [Fundidesulfovibrio magnetotacticus]